MERHRGAQAEGRPASRLAAAWRQVTSPPLLSRIIALVGTVAFVSAVTPVLHERLRIVDELLPPFTPAVARAGAAASGLMLVFLSRGLRRHKHRAWVAAVGLSAVVVFFHVAKGLDIEEAALTAAVLVLLIAGRRQFDAKPDPRSIRAVLGTFVISTALAGGLGWLFLTVMARHQAPGTTAGDRAVEALLGLFGYSGPVVFLGSRAAAVASTTLLVLGLSALGPVIAVVLRPAGGPHPISPEEEERLRSLLAEHGSVDSLGYFTLRRDRSVIFSSTGKAGVSYRVVGGVSLAGGDPVGDPEAWPGAIEAWLEEAHGFGWIPAVLGAGERGATAYRRAGLDVFEIGDEAVIDTREFSLNGRSMRPVRQAVSRVVRAGYQISCDRWSALTPLEAQEVRRAADAWRGGDTERGFSMALGRLGDPADDQCIIVRAHNHAGVLRGLLYFVPWGPDGLSLDLMRRDPESENGTMEAMVAGLVAASADLGVHRLSLNFAVFRSALERGQRLGAGPLTRAWRDVLMLASRWWQIEALYRANAKYQPTWIPRYLCFQRAGDLVPVVLAALRAEAFVALPTLPRIRRRRTVADEPAQMPAADPPVPTDATFDRSATPSSDHVPGRRPRARSRDDRATTRRGATQRS